MNGEGGVGRVGKNRGWGVEILFDKLKYNTKTLKCSELLLPFKNNIFKSNTFF